MTTFTEKPTAITPNRELQSFFCHLDHPPQAAKAVWLFFLLGLTAASSLHALH